MRRFVRRTALRAAWPAGLSTLRGARLAHNACAARPTPLLHCSEGTPVGFAAFIRSMIGAAPQSEADAAGAPDRVD
ncbi:MAG: hypothetical protein ACO3IB_11305, partial [Phycisphaerales bacterium]